MTAAELNHPATAGRVVWAVTASLLAHALLITVTGGRGSGDGWPAAVSIQPRPVISATLTGNAADTLAVADTLPVAIEATANAGPGANPSEQAGGGQPGSSIGLAAPTHYHPARELDIRPQIRSQVEPSYPRSAFEQGQAGSVRLRILIDAQGRVDDVIASGRDAGDPFAAAAVAAFRAARYTPGVKNGLAVPSEVMIEVQFETFSAVDAFRGGSYQR
jgi:TonB family protein